MSPKITVILFILACLMSPVVKAEIITFNATIEIINPPRSTIPGLFAGRTGSLVYSYDTGLFDQDTTGLGNPFRGLYGPIEASLDFGSGDSVSVLNAQIAIIDHGPFFVADVYNLSFLVDGNAVTSGLFSGLNASSSISWLLRGDGSDQTSITDDSLPFAAPDLSEFRTNTVSFTFPGVGVASGTVTTVELASQVTAVPEPSMTVAIGLGIGCIGAARFRRKRRGRVPGKIHRNGQSAI